MKKMSEVEFKNKILGVSSSRNMLKKQECAFNALYAYEKNCIVKYDYPDNRPSRPLKRGETMLDYASRFGTTIKEMKNCWLGVEKFIKNEKNNIEELTGFKKYFEENKYRMKTKDELFEEFNKKSPSGVLVIKRKDISKEKIEEFRKEWRKMINSKGIKITDPKFEGVDIFPKEKAKEIVKVNNKKFILGCDMTKGDDKTIITIIDNGKIINTKKCNIPINSDFRTEKQQKELMKKQDNTKSKHLNNG